MHFIIEMIELASGRVRVSYDPNVPSYTQWKVTLKCGAMGERLHLVALVMCESVAGSFARGKELDD